MKIICAWCKKPLGEKPGEGISHGICDDCERKFLDKLNSERKENDFRFISYEPALEYVNFRTDSLSYFSWLISGGESGYQPRPANLNWFRQVRDDCQANGVLYFHKQHGGSKKINGVWGGRVLDGQAWDQIPLFEVAAGPAKPEQMRMF